MSQQKRSSKTSRESKAKSFDGSVVALNSAGKRTFVILLAALCASGLFGLWKIYSKLESRTLSAAALSFSEGKMERAFEQFESVDKKAVNSRVYHRVEAELESIVDPQQALLIMKSALDDLKVERGVLSFNEQRLLELAVSLSARNGDWELLGELVVLAEQRGIDELPDVLAAKAWLRVRESDFKGAFEYVKMALLENPYHPESVMLRAWMQAKGSNLLERNAAKIRLQELGSRDDLVGIDALVVLLSESDALLDNRELVTVIKALQRHPYFEQYSVLKKPELIRSIVSKVIGIDPSIALFFSERLRDIGEMTMNDWGQRAIAAIALEKPEEAETAIEEAKAAGADILYTATLESRLFLLKGDCQSALDSCLLILDSEADSAQKTSFYQVLGRIQEHPRSTVPQRMEATRRLFLWDGANVQQWLRTGSLAWDYWPERREELARAMVGTAEFEHRKALASFFLERGQAERALDVLDRFEQAPLADTSSIRVASLIALKRFDEAEKMLKEVDGLGAFEKAFSTLEIQLASGHVEESQLAESWKSAVASIDQEASRKQYSLLGMLAHSSGLKSKALGFYAKWYALLSSESGTRIDERVGSNYARLLLSEGRTEDGRQVLAALIRSSPENQEYSFQYAYLSLLLGQDVLAAKDVLREFYSKDENNDRYRFGFAFALARSGQPGLALELISGKSDHSNYSFIEYAVLAANGKMEEAKAIGEGLKTQNLLIEEKALLSRYETGE